MARVSIQSKKLAATLPRSSIPSRRERVRNSDTGRKFIDTHIASADCMTDRMYGISSALYVLRG